MAALLVVSLLLLPVACRPAPPPAALPTATGIVDLPGSVAGPAGQALPFLIEAERRASRARDLGTLSQLWAPDGRIVDGRNTPNTDDDYIWQGRAAILDRYVLAVFPNPPPPLDPLQGLLVHEQEGRAGAVNDQDRWQAVWHDGRWWLWELAYQIP